MCVYVCYVCVCVRECVREIERERERERARARDTMCGVCSYIFMCVCFEYIHMNV